MKIKSNFVIWKEKKPLKTETTNRKFRLHCLILLHLPSHVVNCVGKQDWVRLSIDLSFFSSINFTNFLRTVYAPEFTVFQCRKYGILFLKCIINLVCYWSWEKIVGEIDCIQYVKCYHLSVLHKNDTKIDPCNQFHQYFSRDFWTKVLFKIFL